MPTNSRDRRTRLVAHGATFPCSMEAEQALAARGLLLLPEPCSTMCGALAHCHARRQYPSKRVRRAMRIRQWDAIA